MSTHDVNPDSVWWAWGASALIFALVAHDLRADVRRLVSARNVVLVGIFVWYLLEAVQAGPAVFAYGSAAYERGVLLVVLATVSFLAGYHRSHAAFFDGLALRVARLQDWSFRCQVLTVGVLLGLIPVVLFGLADPAETLRGLVAGRAGWRGTLIRGPLGDFRSCVVMLENFLLGAAWIAILILGDRRRTRGIALVAGAVLAWHLIRAYGTGSRSLVFLGALIPAAWYFWRSDERRQKGLILAAIPLALAFYWFAAALVAGRDQGRLELFARPSYVGHEMFRELLFITNEVPAHRPYLYGHTLFVELINPIPRFLWQNKPLGFGAVYATWQGHEPLTGGPTLSPGIIGEMYVNFGVAGVVLLSVLGGIVCRAWDRIGPSTTGCLPILMFYSMGLGCLLMLGRSFSMSLFYQIIASLICLELAAFRFRRVRGDLLEFPWQFRYST